MQLQDPMSICLQNLYILSFIIIPPHSYRPVMIPLVSKTDEVVSKSLNGRGGVTGNDSFTVVSNQNRLRGLANNNSLSALQPFVLDLPCAIDNQGGIPFVHRYFYPRP
jgi:hypothetical protein